MAVMGSLGCGGTVCLPRNYDFSKLVSNQNGRACSLMVSNQQSSKSCNKILAMASMGYSSSSLSSKVSLQPFPKQRREGRQKVENELLYEKIDGWMRDSVEEIVKKLPESPLLVHVYSDNNTTKTRTEKAEEDNWVSVKQKWEKGVTPMPDGVIFVEQIDDEDGGEQGAEKNEEVSRAWGVVVQGKGEEGCAPPACYLLKTSKVSSGFGLRCTHFCLVKVKSFRETALSQLKNCWLLQGN